MDKGKHEGGEGAAEKGDVMRWPLSERSKDDL